VLISNLKNNHAFPETFPGNEFPALLCAVHTGLFYRVGIARNSAAIYCRVMIQVWYKPYRWRNQSESYCVGWL